MTETKAVQEQDKKFFIVVTGYNCSRYVRECIRSFQFQTYQNFEVVFIDDGSTDDTAKQIKDNIPNDPRYSFVIYTENKFAAFRRYQAIYNLGERPDVDGESLIMTVDLDDQLHSNALALVKAQYDKGVWMTYGNWVDQYGRTNPLPLRYNRDEIRDRNFRRLPYLPVSPNTFKKKLWDRIPATDYQMDGQWLDTCTETGFRFSCLELCGMDRVGIIEEPIYKYNAWLPGNSQRRKGVTYKEEIKKFVLAQPKKYLYEHTRIEQCYLSDSLVWFKKGFMERYGLKEYHDPEAPCIFVGVYGVANAHKIKEHKGFKVAMFCGSDIRHAKRIRGAPGIMGHLSDMHIYEQRIKEIIPVNKYLTIPMKSFDIFKSVPLGDKIYFYARTKKDAWEIKFRMDILEKVKKHFGEDRVLLGYQGNTIETMRDEYYAKSFINLNFTKEVGFTSCLEMAHMGRRSISNYPAAFCKPYQSEDEIIRLIEEEMQYIGQTREVVSEAARMYYPANDEWLNVSYWINK